MPSSNATTTAPFGATAMTALSGSAVGDDGMESSSTAAPPGAWRVTTRRVDTLSRSIGIVTSVLTENSTAPSAYADWAATPDAGTGNVMGVVQLGAASADPIHHDPANV